MTSNEYFGYILSDDYLCPENNNINESAVNSLYENDVNYFANISLSEMLPMMYIMENKEFTETDLILLESGYEQYASAQPLNEFMGNSTHLYGNQIGVGATDWMHGLSGPLKWLGGLIGGTLAALFGLLGWLLKKGKQLVGVALLRRYIEKIAAITDEGYKNMCNLFTSKKNRACFRTFQQASERDIIVSTDVCAKALGLLDNSLEYKEDQNPYIQAESLISDVHDEYLEDVVTAKGWFGFNKLIDKPQEKIDNTKDLAATYGIKIKNAYNKNQMSNHQQNDPASNESYNYTSYNTLNEYKSEEEHYASTENYAKYLDAYLVAIRNAWETLCKRLIGEIQIGGELEYLKQNQKLNINPSPSNHKKPKLDIKSDKIYKRFYIYAQNNPPKGDEAKEKWILNCIEKVWGFTNRQLNIIKSDIEWEDRRFPGWWRKIKEKLSLAAEDPTVKDESIKEAWEVLKNIISISSLSESQLFEYTEQGVIRWRNEDIDNNLIQQMSNWLQRKDRFEWKITNDFKKKCTELATAVDKEIIARINRWTTPSGAPGSTGLNNKGYNSPITKAGLEKMWAAYKEELNNRIEARVDNFVTGNPFMYAVQFLQFTVPSLMKDVLNKVDPNNMQRDNTYTFNYGIIQNHFTLGDLIESDDQDALGSPGIINITPLSDEEREIIIQSTNEQNESYTLFKGSRFKLFEDDMNKWNTDDDDSDHDDLDDNELNIDNSSDNKDSGESEDDKNSPDENEYSLIDDDNNKDNGLLIDGYSVAVSIIKNNDIENIINEFNQNLSYKNTNYMFIPGVNCRDGNPPLKSVGNNAIIGKICKNNKIYDILGENTQIYYFNLETDNNDKNPMYLKSLDVKNLVDLYKTEKTNDERKGNNQSESKEYAWHNILNEDDNLDDGDLNINFDDTDNTQNNSQQNNDSKAEEFISMHSIIKCPLFWYGNKVVLPEDELTEDLMVMQIPDDVKTKFLESVKGDDESDENNQDNDFKEEGVYWPVSIDDLPEEDEDTNNQTNESEEFSYSSYNSLNEKNENGEKIKIKNGDVNKSVNDWKNKKEKQKNDVKSETPSEEPHKKEQETPQDTKNSENSQNGLLNADDVPAEDKSENSSQETNNQNSSTELTTTQVDPTGKPSYQAAEEAKNNFLELDRKYKEDKKEQKEDEKKYGKLSLSLNDEVKGKGILIKDSEIAESPEFNVTINFTTDKKDGVSYVMKNNKWIPEFNEESMKKGIKSLTFENISGSSFKVDTNKKDLLFLKFDDLYSDLIKFIGNALRGENTEIKQIIPNISVWAADQSWGWSNCLNDDENKYTKSPIKQKDIFIVEKQ